MTLEKLIIINSVWKEYASILESDKFITIEDLHISRPFTLTNEVKTNLLNVLSVTVQNDK